MSIFQLSSLVANLPDRKQKLFQRIYDLDSLPGRLKLISGVREWTAKRFGSVEEVEKQKIVRITNLITGEGALFNHLRGKRPIDAHQDRDLDALVDSYRQGCPFCSPLKRTPADVFGRIEGAYCTTAANVAKYDGFHSLVIPREHHPLKFNKAMVEDYFRVAARWFIEASRYAAKEGDRGVYYPFLMWNCLWPAGSSVVHGHLQLTLTRGRHYPKIDWLRRCSLIYKREYGSNYFTDLYDVHSCLGLGWSRDVARYMSILTPIKEKETWIIIPGQASPERLVSAGRSVFGVLKCLKEKAALNSFNVVLYLPPLNEEETGWSDFPFIARIVDRGSVFNRTADVGAMELYATSVISSDPFAVAQLLCPQ
ncbi:MAG: hypothetical protein FH756_03585 [Firmicutes bacterium]|nr:hypothetical protein [Bacillota bacterium]